MKHKNRIYYIILILTTLLGMWILPALLKKATYKPDNYPFVYYSCIVDELCLIDYQNKTAPVQDIKGNTYSTAEADSILPLLNYRQLMVDGRLPDSIKGQEINPKVLRAKSVNFRTGPTDIQTPVTELYMLFESMPKRVGLKMPDDVLRLKNEVEFIDTETNKVNADKSKRFQEAFDKEGYTFPTQWASGNPNPRKPYDEGYFCLDAKGNLFHLKMVNDRPFLKNTHISDKINIDSFSMLEVADKRFYGFLFSKEGEIYIIENEAGNYQTMKLDIDPIDRKHDQVIIMGNLLDWTVSVITPEEKKCYALDNTTLTRLSEFKIAREESKWEKVSAWVFPFYLTFESKYSDYLSPTFHYTGIYAFIINFILAIIIGIFIPNTRNKRVFNSIFILITGIAGVVALLLLPDFRRRNR